MPDSMEALEALVFVGPKATAKAIQLCAQILGAVDVLVGGPEAVAAILKQRERGVPDPRMVDLRKGSEH